MRSSKLLNSISVSLLAVLFTCTLVQGQEIDILLKGGHVIDPRNKIDGLMDVAIAKNKIVQVAPDIAPERSKKVIYVKGLYVTPGLIDIHVHVFSGTNTGQEYMDGPSSVPPDGFTFRSGVTTVVDAGSSGWKSFPIFKKNIIDRSKTRVLAFLNIVGDGMGRNQQDVNDMDPRMAATTATNYPNYIVGFKVAHFNGLQWIPIDSAVAAGKIADKPVMIDWRGLPPDNSLEDLFVDHLRPGDILTHMYHAGKGPGNSPIYKEAVTENGKVRPYVFQAEKKGILFDVGHGGNGFLFNQAVPSMAQGFKPYSISSDLHIGSMNAGMKDMANIMSKFINMGMSIQETILRSTWQPALSIKRPDLGSLSVGAEADVAVLNLKTGDFGFVDSHDNGLRGTKKLETELTIRAGKVEWDLNGLSTASWISKPVTTN